jgi:hypothetical protein
MPIKEAINIWAVIVLVPWVIWALLVFNKNRKGKDKMPKK